MFRKYVSYGFPIINFCNPGVHYETPCIYIYIYHNIISAGCAEEIKKFQKGVCGVGVVVSWGVFRQPLSSVRRDK
jgi:hypothetical protein